MSISLTPEQQTWLKAHVELGEFPSIDEAARQLIDERIAERMAAENSDRVFDNPDALIALAQRSFDAAARAAVAENDRLGIPTHGSVAGQLVIRQPLRAVTVDQT